MISWEVFKVDGYNNPLCAPVTVRARTRERAEEIGKHHLSEICVKNVRRVYAREWRPEFDRDFEVYIFKISS